MFRLNFEKNWGFYRRREAVAAALHHRLGHVSTASDLGARGFPKIFIFPWGFLLNFEKLGVLAVAVKRPLRTAAATLVAGPLRAILLGGTGTGFFSGSFEFFGSFESFESFESLEFIDSYEHSP